MGVGANVQRAGGATGLPVGRLGCSETDTHGGSMTTPHTPRCIARHSGLWCIEPRWMQAAWASIRAGTYRMLEPDEAEKQSVPPTRVTEDGIGILQMNGVMMKGASKYANVDTVEVRRVVRTWAADPN